MDWTEILKTIITVGGTIAVAAMTYKSSKESKRGADASSSVKEEIGVIKETLAKNDLRTCRIDFRQALSHSRDDIPAILELASEYFLDFGGNADMGRKFLYWIEEYKVEEWAKKHQVDLDPLIEAAGHNRRK